MLVPRPKYIDTKIKNNQSVFDIVNQIKLAILNSYWQASKVSNEIENKSKGTIDYLFNVWKLSKKIIQYQKEPFHSQTAKEFSRIWHDGFGDCKHFTIFIVSIIKNNPLLKDKVYLRIINHNGKDFTHIYPIIKINNKEIYIDGTASKFNNQAKFIKKIDFKI